MMNTIIKAVGTIIVAAALLNGTTAMAATVNDLGTTAAVKNLQVKKTLLLKGTNAAIQQKGSRPVKIKDTLRVTKNLDVRGNLQDKKGDLTIKDTVVPKSSGTFDLGSSELLWNNLYVTSIFADTINGIDVEELDTRITALENVTPVVDTDTNTTYTAGTGLTLTGTTFSNDLGTSIDTTEIADGTITNDDLNLSYLTIEDAPVETRTRRDLANTSSETVLTSTSESLTTRMRISTAGNPIVAYLDTTSGASLEVAYCTTPDCSAVTNTIVATNVAGVDLIDMVLDPVTGYPVISYTDATSDELLLAICNSVDCSSSTSVNVSDGNDNVDITRIATNEEGNYVIAYYGEDGSGNDGVWVNSCNDSSCSTVTSEHLYTSSGNIFYLDMVMGADGYPFMAFYDDNVNDLLSIHCTNVTCGTVDTTVTLVNNASDTVGHYVSIAIGDNYLPVMGYYNEASGGTYDVLSCDDIACSTSTARNIENDGTTYWYGSLTIGDNNNPIMSYWDFDAEDLKVATCLDSGCKESVSRAVVATGDSGRFSSIDILPNGRPVVAYHDKTNSELELYVAANQLFLDNWVNR